MLPPSKEGIIEQELQAIGKALNNQKNLFEEELGLDIELTVQEKELLKEFIGYLKYIRK